MPLHVSASLSPTSVTGAGSSTLTIKVNKQAKTGPYNILITGKSGNLSHTTSLTLTVQ
jgi:uncharacterized membrane protein